MFSISRYSVISHPCATDVHALKIQLKNEAISRTVLTVSRVTQVGDDRTFFNDWHSMEECV